MKTIACLLLASFSVINGAVEDVIGTCNLGENPCEKDQFNRVLQELAENGMPEVNIPVLDPLEIENIKKTTHDNLLEFELIHGYVNGIKSAEVTDIEINTNDLSEKLVVRCDINIDCRYKAKASGGAGLFLNDKVIHGDGKAKITLNGLVLTIYKTFSVNKDGDNYYLYCKTANGTYGYDYKVDKVIFDINNVYLGKLDISNLVNNLLNSDWRIYFKRYGRDFLDIAMEIIYEYNQKFFDNVPAQTFVEDIADYYNED